jgi:hypothetical protein
LVVLRNPELVVRITSRCPAVISPSPKMMMGVMEMSVMMMMEANTSRHMVETDKQLSKELL